MPDRESYPDMDWLLNRIEELFDSYAGELYVTSTAFIRHRTKDPDPVIRDLVDLVERACRHAG